MTFRFASEDPTLNIILKHMKSFIFSGDEFQPLGRVKRVGHYLDMDLHLEPEQLHSFS